MLEYDADGSGALEQAEFAKLVVAIHEGRPEGRRAAAASLRRRVAATGYAADPITVRVRASARASARARARARAWAILGLRLGLG